jgi:type VI protein secretion system component VasF
MTFEITLQNERQALALAYFCKRLTFDGAYETAHGADHEEMKSMTYDILEGVTAIQKGLSKKGFAPR